MTLGETVAYAQAWCFFFKSTWIGGECCAAFGSPTHPQATRWDFINVLKGDILHLFPFALLLLSLLGDPLHPRLLRTEVSLFISIPGAGMHNAVDSHIMHIMKRTVGFRLRIANRYSDLTECRLEFPQELSTWGMSQYLKYIYVHLFLEQWLWSITAWHSTMPKCTKMN